MLLGMRVLTLKSDFAENINADVPLAKACVNDADKFCQKLDAGVTVLACLREKKDDLSSECKSEVFERQENAANDWRTDNELLKACEVRFSWFFQIIAFICSLSKFPSKTESQSLSLSRLQLIGFHEQILQV